MTADPGIASARTVPPATVAAEALSLLRVWGGEAVADAFDAPPRSPLIDLIAFAERHGIGHALSSALGQAHAAFGAEAVTVLLASAQQAREAEAAALFAQLQRIAEAFAFAGIDAVALKGAAHPAKAGAPTPWREMIDLDLLVAQRDLPAAVAALKTLKYAGDEAAYLDGSDYHYPALFPPADGGPATVELHTRLGWTAGPPPETETLREASMPSSLPPLRVPSREDRLAHLVRHAMLADRGHATRALRLRDALDWKRLDGAGMQERLESRFAEAGAGAEFRAFAVLMGRVWNEPVPAAWRREAAPWAEETLAGLSDPEAVARRIAKDRRGEALRALTAPETRTHVLRGLLKPARLRRFLRRLTD